MIGSLGGRVTRSRWKLPLLVEARENSATGGQTSDKLQECSPEDTKVASDRKKNTKLASYHKKTKVKVASYQKKKNVKVASHQKKKRAKVVPKEPKKAVAENPTPGGLTPEQLQEYSRKDFDYTEFHGCISGFTYLKAVQTQINPKRPASYDRERLNSDCAMEYYNREFGVNYCDYTAPLLMTSRVVGGGYLDFITLDACKLDQNAYERFQAIVYNAPGEEPKVLMCRPELRSTAYRGSRVYGTRGAPVAAYLDSL